MNGCLNCKTLVACDANANATDDDLRHDSYTSGDLAAWQLGGGVAAAWFVINCATVYSLFRISWHLKNSGSHLCLCMILVMLYIVQYIIHRGDIITGDPFYGRFSIDS